MSLHLPITLRSDAKLELSTELIEVGLPTTTSTENSQEAWLQLKLRKVSNRYLA
jgi:hypothetical protein